jgi:hypothetical protein
MVPIERRASARRHPSPVVCVQEDVPGAVSRFVNAFAAVGAAPIEPNNAFPIGIAPAPTLNVPDISPVCCSDPLPQGNWSFWLMPSGSGQRFVDDDAADVLVLVPVSVGLGLRTSEK